MIPTSLHLIIHTYLYQTVHSQNYLLIERHIDVLNGYFSTNILQTGIENENNPNANTYCIIGTLISSRYLIDSTHYQFRLIYQYRNESVSNDTLIWTQTSWITEPVITGADLSEIDELDDNLQRRFRGLGLSNVSKSYLDGNGIETTDWWHAVASVIGTAGKDAIPAHIGRFAYSSSLFVLVPDTDTPTVGPSINPTVNPSVNPSLNPSAFPSVSPTVNPSYFPTSNSSTNPTSFPLITTTEFEDSLDSTELLSDSLSETPQNIVIVTAVAFGLWICCILTFIILQNCGIRKRLMKRWMERNIIPNMTETVRSTQSIESNGLSDYDVSIAPAGGMQSKPVGIGNRKMESGTRNVNNQNDDNVDCSALDSEGVQREGQITS